MEVDSPVASTATPSAAALPDLLPQHVHEHVDENMGLDTPEQLLTPENSRSETSSNNENASSNEEKPTLRRKSTRVTRASLRVSELENPKLEEEKYGGFEATKGGVAGLKKSQSSHLRHSIAVMESSLWSETDDARINTETDKQQFVPDTPISETSPDPIDTSLQQKTLRKRVERISSKEETPDKEKATAESKDNEDEQPLRRSSRRSTLEKASELLDRASSVLGKRSRNGAEKGKDPDRRTSLRPRNVAPPKEESATSTTNEPSAAKKRRVSESDLPSKNSQEEESADEEQPESSPAPSFRPKRWLAHGLYSGQEPTGSRPSQKENKTTKRRSQRKLLPMPLFAGDRLLKNGRDFQLPFDIFSPLPPGQPKPNEWRKTNKNVFVGEAGSIWRANKNMELSKCMCIPETGCDENCQNRYMFYECDNGNCALGLDCGNRSFDEIKQRTKAGGKYNVGVEVIKTPDRGYGVRSNRTFEANQIIVEYTGEIITQSECEKRMRTIYKKNECYYLMYFDQNMIIDATRGSIARFVNHSCEPNCRMEKWTVSGKPRMALFAGDRGIMTGEELTYDYNFDPYSQKNVQQCRCGAPMCRGVLGPRPREKEQRSKERESKADNQKKSTSNTKKTETKATGSKRKTGSTIEESTSRLNKKRKVVTPRARSRVTKTVSKARTSISKTAATRKREPATKQKTKETTRKTAAAAKATPAKTGAKAKANVKLPKVKSNTKVKATVRTTKKTSAAAKAKVPTKLNRPSATTKAKILATAQGTGARKRTTKKADTKEQAKPVQRRNRKGAKAQSKAKDIKSPPKKAARSVKANGK